MTGHRHSGWQSGWQPDSGGRPESPPAQLWWWGPDPRRGSADIAATAPATPLRIGDLERDRAVSDLGDHFAAGRLTREEFDERADQAMQARFSSELDPLFADLPQSQPDQPQPMQPPGPQSWGRPRPFVGPPPFAFWLLPVLLLGAVAGAILFHAPFLLWILVWVAVISKVTSHRRRYRRAQVRQQGPFGPPGR